MQQVVEHEVQWKVKEDATVDALVKQTTESSASLEYFKKHAMDARVREDEVLESLWLMEKDLATCLDEVLPKIQEVVLLSQEASSAVRRVNATLQQITDTRRGLLESIMQAEDH